MKAILSAVFCLGLFLPGAVVAADQDLVARWSFDENAGQAADAVSGLYKYVKGVSGTALRFDGYTTAVTRDAPKVPALGGAFTVEAWVALEAYPWTWCAIVDHEQNEQAGYYFALDPKGRFGLHLAVDDLWRTVSSPDAVPLYRWNHLAGVYDPAHGVSLYLNGKLVRSAPIQGKPTFAEHTDMSIGRNTRPRPLAYPLLLDPPSPFSRPLPAPISLDGILDEVSIYSRAVGAEEIGKRFAAMTPSGPDPLKCPVLPTGPRKPGRFGAYYTRLRYTETWERSWRVDEHPDVVVRFDDAPYEFVFWRGARVPCWVSENNIWYNNQFFETWDPGMTTGAEPLADKQARYSHVKIIESNEARVVLHWRYAPIQIDYQLAHTDATGWSDWVNEYYTIYPDGTGVRKIKVWSSRARRVPGTGSLREYHESIIVNPPGTRPEDNIKPKALTLANLAGEEHTYSWAGGPPGIVTRADQATIDWMLTENPDADRPGRKWLSAPTKPAIHLVRLKAQYSPWVIIDPKLAMIAAFGSLFGPSGQMFPWWNHWPVAQIYSFGRYAVTPDRASHSSLTHIYWPPVEESERGVTKLMLHGMTDKTAADLVPLARSWLLPPKAGIRGTDFTSQGYDPAELAYRVTRKNQADSAALDLTLAASEQSPAVNPAIMIRDWGGSRVAVKIDGRPLEPGKGYRAGAAHRVDGSDLVVWIRTRAAKPVTISLSPAGR